MIDRRIHIAIFFIIFPLLVFSQINSKKNNMGEGYIGVGVDMGITQFFGDIDEGPSPGGYLQNNLAVRVSAVKSFNSLFLLGGQILTGKVSGEKKRGSSYHYYFNANFTEYSFYTEFNLFGIFTKSVNRKFNIYASVGLGLVDFKTKLYDGVNDSIVKSWGYGGQESTTESVIPFGLRADYHINKRIVINGLLSTRKINTDKLDGVSGNNNTDYFGYYSLGVIYKFYPGSANKNFNKSRKGNRGK